MVLMPVAGDPTISFSVQFKVGSQDDTHLVYVGASHFVGEAVGRYGADASRDQVAVATRRAPGRIVLEFPRPVVESVLDVMVLER